MKSMMKFILPLAILSLCVPAFAGEASNRSNGASLDRPVSPVPALRSLEPDPATGTSLAVVVGDAPLLHTAQLLPLNRKGELVGAGDVAAQTEQVLANLAVVLGRPELSKAPIAKLNFVLAQDDARPKVQAVLAKVLRRGFLPAVSFVTGDLPHRGALVAMDAVVLMDASPPRESAPPVYPSPGVSLVSMLPAGPKVFVSGMADTNSLLIATRRTLEKLLAAIGHLGLAKADVVQLKVFLQPMSEVAAVRKEVADFFGGKAPPTIFVEWISPPPNPPIEIELIAAARGDFSNEQESVSFLTPPGATSTKVYSRVVRVNHGELVYVSGLYGDTSPDAAGQIREMFGTLRDAVKWAGSDLEHLAKATYYVTDNDASNKLNDIRPEFYNPQRPPAASKAKVKGVGLVGKTVAMDMIAVTK